MLRPTGMRNEAFKVRGQPLYWLIQKKKILFRFYDFVIEYKIMVRDKCNGILQIMELGGNTIKCEKMLTEKQLEYLTLMQFSDSLMSDFLFPAQMLQTNLKDIFIMKSINFKTLNFPAPQLPFSKIHQTLIPTSHIPSLIMHGNVPDLELLYILTF